MCKSHITILLTMKLNVVPVKLLNLFLKIWTLICLFMVFRVYGHPFNMRGTDVVLKVALSDNSLAMWNLSHGFLSNLSYLSLK